MDETLAELYTMYYFIESLRLKETIKETIPNVLQKSLNKAYKKFVKAIVKEEELHPLGILRPGILDIMSTLYTLHKAGKVKSVIIYSNSGHLESLEFIRDLIHLHIGGTLIKKCIHFFINITYDNLSIFLCLHAAYGRTNP